MSNNEDSDFSHRGSSSEHASSYKLQGMKDEDEFASLISGKVIPGQQKVDVIGHNETRYSVKGGIKKWQILA